MVPESDTMTVPLMKLQALEGARLLHAHLPMETPNRHRLQRELNGRVDDLLWSCGGHSRVPVPWRPLPWQQ